MSPIITFNNVCKTFGDFHALTDVSFSIEEGDFFALLGPNGAVKTTLLSILIGLQKASGGEVRVREFDVVTDYRKTRKILGAVPQELVFDPFFTVREALQFQSGYFGIRRNDDWIDELLVALHLSDKADTNTRMLSGGMKRRLMVAQALVHRPPLIVLDEPTAGVDVELRRELWKFIRRLNDDGHTILLTTHYLQEAEALANRIGMLKGGKLVALENKDKLMQRYSANVLRLRTEASAVDALQTLGFPVSIQNDGWLSLPISKSHDIEAILANLHRAKLPIEAVEIQPTDLEEVFLHVLHDEQTT